MNNKALYKYTKEQQEIETIKNKYMFKGKTDKELILFYLNHFYEFILKSTRMVIISDIYDFLSAESKKYNYYEETYQINESVEKLFIKISNQLYLTSPDKQSIMFMISSYISLLVESNIELTKRLIKEVYDLMSQVNRMIQLYYNGDGKGRVVYIHLYDSKEKIDDSH